jgi:predicted RecB family endonuclease
MFWRDRDVRKMLEGVVSDMTAPLTESQSKMLDLMRDNLAELERIRLESAFAERIGRLEALLETLDARITRIEDHQ